MQMSRRNIQQHTRRKKMYVVDGIAKLWLWKEDKSLRLLTFIVDDVSFLKIF